MPCRADGEKYRQCRSVHSIIGATQKRRDNAFGNLCCLSVDFGSLVAAAVVPFPPHFALFFRTSKLTCLAWVTIEGTFLPGRYFRPRSTRSGAPCNTRHLPALFRSADNALEQKAEDLPALDRRRVRNSYARLVFFGQHVQRVHVYLLYALCICLPCGRPLTCEKSLEGLRQDWYRCQCPRRECEDANRRYIMRATHRGSTIASRRTRRVSKSVCIVNFRR